MNNNKNREAINLIIQITEDNKRKYEAMSKLKSSNCILREALKDKIKQLGIDLKKHLITTCGSGVTAAILYVIFKDLGVKKISLYDGSWCEWGSQDEFEVETG